MPPSGPLGLEDTRAPPTDLPSSATRPCHFATQRLEIFMVARSSIKRRVCDEWTRLFSLISEERGLDWVGRGGVRCTLRQVTRRICTMFIFVLGGDRVSAMMMEEKEEERPDDGRGWM
ncbi:hypothetical protein E2C01_032314 [Portunus trituberculatus]|uniref:Uncharacterized protein n=1 Tax=Portunus trituberculatus TaxID=210409 RepID=A0A5B7F0L7_PORTR|nr:hypothetical protein [Portunus trituberculatus]